MTLRYAGAMKAGMIFIAATSTVLIFALLVNVNFGLPFNLSLWPPGQDYVLRASFKDANGVSRGADVQIAGHNIGQVTAVSVAGNQAVVTMRISQTYAPIHRGTIAKIRYSTLLAQKYVELAPVSGNQTIPTGGSIPSNETVTPVDFDQFISALDPPTRQKLQLLIQQLGTGVDGRQETINQLLDQLHALSVESKPPLDTFAAHTDNIDHIVTNLSITGDRLAQSHENLGQLIQSADDVNGRLADQNAALAGLIRHLGNLMADFNVTLDGNQGNLHQTVVLLDPLVGELNVAFGTTDGYLSANLGNLQDGFNRLSPEGESAIHQKDANGNYLRQYLVADSACDQINTTYNDQCGTGKSGSPSPSSPSSPGPSGPNSPVAGSGAPAPTAPAPAPTPSCDPLQQLLGKC